MCEGYAGGGIFAGVREYTGRTGAAAARFSTACTLHMQAAAPSSPLASQTVMDGHFSSNSVVERCSIIDIPIQQNVPTVLDLTRADPN